MERLPEVQKTESGEGEQINKITLLSSIGSTPDYDKVIEHLEMETKRMREEFDLQRAKFKDLFLQKESELSRARSDHEIANNELKKCKSQLDEIRSQLLVADLQMESNVTEERRKAKEEIASLQQLVQETVEESSSTRVSYDNEIKKLQMLISRLESENLELKQNSSHPSTDSTSLAPSVISAVTKKIVKKLGADSFTSQEDDHREDTELLKSLVGPLEEEIKALKDKLRATDEQLQQCTHCSKELELEFQQMSSDTSALDNKSIQHSISTNTSFETKMHTTSCDMCSNYEAQLVREQKRCLELESKLTLTEKAVERHKEDLLKEIGFRKDMEEKWSIKKEEHRQQVTELTRRMQCCELDLKEFQELFQRACEEMKDNLMSLSNDREHIQKELIRLQQENDQLVGKYSQHSQEIQSQMINFPDTVADLQELLLQTHQDLIIAKIGKEAAESHGNDLESDLMLMKDQITQNERNLHVMQSNLLSEIDQLREQKEQIEKQKMNFQSNLENYKSFEKETQETIKELNVQLEEMRTKKKKIEAINAELKTQITSLQQELDTSETVQKDFVLLSQELQVQLEKIRDADTQVRWQHDEDVSDCPSCHSTFSSSKKKEHCRHCGQIFCYNCLSHVVKSGPNQRPSKVCVVCHTLLVKSSAPYFSTEAPHSPD